MKKALGTVMVIDDEDIDQRQYRRILQRSEMTDEIIQFTYADEALEWLLENPDQSIDLIFLDVNIPRMNGFEFLEKYNELLPNLSAPVIVMLTTSLNPADKDKAMTFPQVRSFFTKPLCNEYLEKAVSLLQEPQSHA